MSSAKTRAVSEINLEEFERRLRAAGAPQPGVEDPLSELTRLVNTIAAERPRSEKIVDIARARMPKAEPFPAAPPPRNEAQPSSRSAPQPSRDSEVAPPPAAVAAPSPAAAAAPPPAPVATDPAPSLRASFAEATPAAASTANDAELAGAEAPHHAAALNEHSLRAPLEAGERIPLAPLRRPRSWYLKVASLTALAVLMVGGAAAMKIGMPGLNKSPPLILAADGPSKVAPPNEATVQSAGDTGSLLLKDSAAPAAPIKLVSTEEQPVDLLAQTPAPAPKAFDADRPTQAPAPKAFGAGGQLAPPPETPIVAPTEGLGGAPASGPTLFPSAKRVKTVSVRPDGTVISSDSTPDAATAANPAPSPTLAPPARKTDDSGAAALAATPTLDIPAKPEASAKAEIPAKPETPIKSSAKSSARVNTAKTEPTVLADAGNAPLQLSAQHTARSRAAKPKPAPVLADATPTSAEADATPTFETASTGGRWAVQLAAPRSESEAEGAISRLQSKYGDDLGSKTLAVHKAEVGGETIYRVRASGLSKAEALAMCKKLKASGGDCFVARN